ncbi:MAG: YncE family protein, partial [Thaumarchaeota archaeon]|nr:YncE family protein [Nitrososphaerota archaeon]
MQLGKRARRAALLTSVSALLLISLVAAGDIDPGLSESLNLSAVIGIPNYLANESVTLAATISADSVRSEVVSLVSGAIQTAQSGLEPILLGGTATLPTQGKLELVSLAGGELTPHSSGDAMTLVSSSTHPGGSPTESEGDCIFLSVGHNAPVLQSCNGAGNGLTTVTVGAHPLGVAYDPSNGYVYVTNSQAGSLTELRGLANTETVSVGRDPVAAAFDSSNGDVYVADSGQDAVSVVSAASMQVLATVSVGVNPQGLAYSSSVNAVY